MRGRKCLYAFAASVVMLASACGDSDTPTDGGAEATAPAVTPSTAGEGSAETQPSAPADSTADSTAETVADTQPEPAEPLPKIQIALASFSFGHALSLLTGDGGFFEQNGVEVELINANGAQNAVAAVASGDVAAFVGTPSNAFAASEAFDVVMPVKPYAGISNYVTLATGKAEELGLTLDDSVEDRLKALDGLTIASISEASATTQILKTSVESVGAEVTFAYIEQASYVAALESGAVDGFVGSSPFGQIASTRGIGVPWILGPFGEFPGYSKEYMQIGLGFTSDYVTENPDIAARVVAAYLDASEFIQNSPDEAKAILRARFADLEDAVWDDMWEQEAVGAGPFNHPITTMADLEEVYEQYVAALEQGVEAPEIDLDLMLGADVLERAEELRAQDG